MIERRFCPNCGSDNVEMMAGGMTGNFMCNDCEYHGPIFPTKGQAKEDEEDDFESDDMMEEEEILLKRKREKREKKENTEKNKKVKSKVKKVRKSGGKRK